MNDDLAALLGDAPPLPVPAAPTLPEPERRRRGRPTKEEAERRLADEQAIRAAGGGVSFEPFQTFLQPCSQNFLATVLRLDPATVTRRLARASIKPLAVVGGGRPVWNFHEVVPFLVKSQMDMDTFLGTLDPNKLPNHISKAYWEAKRLRLKYELEAGEAWATPDVLAVFGSVFMAMKDQMQLWVDKLAENTELSEDQRDRLMQMVDALQGDMHAKLVEMPANRQTRSLAANGTEPAGFDPEADDEPA